LFTITDLLWIQYYQLQRWSEDTNDNEHAGECKQVIWSHVLYPNIVLEVMECTELT